MLRRQLLAAMFASTVLALPVRAETETPEAFIMRVSGDILKAIREDPRLTQGDMAAIQRLVDNKMMPAVDFLRMTRMAVGPMWRQANDEQRQRLMELFRQILINVYSGALSMAKDQKVRILPNGQNDGIEAIVRTAMASPTQPEVQIVYRLRNLKDKGWRVIDVNVEGVWLVSNYRSQFGSIAANEGIDGLIAKMQERVAQTKKKS